MGNGRIQVAYLSYDGLTDPLGQSQILPYIIGLSKQGYNFNVFSFEKNERLKRDGEFTKQQCELHRIEWFPLTYHRRPPIISTIYDLLILWLRLSDAQTQKKFAIIHCRSYLTSLVGLLAKRKWCIKFIFDMRGLWADERVDGGLWNLTNPLYRSVYQFFKRKELEFLYHADHVISLTENAKKEILTWPVNVAPITVIPTCVDLSLFNPDKISGEDQVKLRARLGIKPDSFVLLYLGSIGTWYMLKEMLDFFYVLRRECRDSKFLVVTQESSTALHLLSGDVNDNIDDIIVRSAVREDVPLYISIATCGIIFIKPTFSKLASFPTKLGEVLSMGLPIVANTGVGDNDYLFRDDNIGVLVDRFDNENFKKAVGQLVALGSPVHLRSFAEKRFSLKNGVELYDNVYKAVLQSNFGMITD